jgi:hypothetical protein
VTTKFYIGQAYVDFCRYGAWIEADGVDGQIASLTTQGEVFASGGQPIAGSHGLRLAAANARVQIGNLRIDTVEDNPLRLEGSGNRIDLFALRCVRFNTRGNGAAAIHLADSGAAAPNAAYLGAPPLLEGGTAGPLVNTGTSGILAMGAPAGRAARPGLMLGGTDTGLFAPAASSLAAAAGGVEVLRATASGTVTLGGAPGGHALEVATPLSAVNRVVVNGGATGGAVAVLAAGADASVGLALAPKGNGALSAHVPDGTAAGGNARGTNAVDWQTNRASAVHVAGGANSIIPGGLQNTASGTHSAAIGWYNTASGIGSLALGTSLTVSGAYSTGIGSNATDRGVYGKVAFACGKFVNGGDAQAGEHVLRRQSTDATATRLTSDGGAPTGANTLNLPNGGTYAMTVLVVARQVGGTAGTSGDSKMWRLDAIVRRGASAAATVLVNATQLAAYGDAAAAAWTAGIAADAGSGGVAITGTGEANKSINWVARVLSVEVVG